MNILRNKQCYLIGSIDRCPDYGITWRKELTPFLQSLCIEVLDPTTKHEESRASVEKRKEWRAKGEYNKITQEMKEIRQLDLRCVDKSDFLICLMNDVPKCGTWNEIFIADQQRKPCLLVFPEQGIVGAPDWLIGCFPEEWFFDSFDSLKTYLLGINNGTIPLHKRWRLS